MAGNCAVSSIMENLLYMDTSDTLSIIYVCKNYRDYRIFLFVYF